MRWLLFLVLSSPVFAIDNIELKLNSITDIDWQIKNIATQLTLSEIVGLELNIASLTLANFKEPLKNIKLHCKNIHYNTIQITCPNAKLYIDWKLLDKPEIDLSVTHHFASQTTYLNINQLAIADGKVFLQAKLTPSGWKLLLKVNRIILEKLLAKLSLFMDLPKNLDIKGKVNINIKAIGNETGFQQLTITGQSNDLNFTFANNIGQNIATKIIATINKISDVEQQLIANVTIKNGNFLIDPIYTVISLQQPITIDADLIWQPQQLKLSNFTYTHTGITSIQANGDFTIGEEFIINKLVAQSTLTPFQNFYQQYLQTWLNNEFDIEQLKFLGSLQIFLDWQTEQQHIIGQLQDIAIKKSEFSLTGLQGTVQWHNNDELPSNLSWSQINIAGIELDASKINFSLTNKNIKLLEPWQQSIYDGAINVKHFQLNNLGSEELVWQLQEVKLQPISIAKLTATLDSLEGNIHGNIPIITYRNQRLMIDGILQIDVFDGSIIISGAELKNNDIVKFNTNIDINRINLQKLTSQVTEFGEIQGLLSGYAHNLTLINWNPVAFDAFIGTPNNDKLPHKISQKAVKALSSLGSGVAVDTLSHSILSLFENFYYNKIGWGCQLLKDVCKMRGIEPAFKGKYYLIEGRLLPRIDIIGYENNVDWKILGSRLKTIIAAFND
ncbi:MAG TPA: hypothetical protein ENK59_06435 [Thioploca sp.]|nr:hypothetical protein [Thioploca sp.]